jgi:hypothetical protein
LSALLAQCASAASRVNSRPVRGQPVGGPNRRSHCCCDQVRQVRCEHRFESIGCKEWNGHSTKKADVSILSCRCCAAAVRAVALRCALYTLLGTRCTARYPHRHVERHRMIAHGGHRCTV